MKMKPFPSIQVAFLFLATLGACRPDKAVTEIAPTPAPQALLATQAVVVVGENYCLGCALKKEQGAAAQCSVYGHRHALRVESATSEGGLALPTLAGETLHYLDNDQSASLLKGEDFHKKRVEVRGKLFARERSIQVAEVKRL